MSTATDSTTAAPATAVPAAIAAHENRLAGASEWRLIWWRFRRHRLAFASGIVVLAIYVVALLADPIAPASTEASKPQYTYAPPQMLHLFRATDSGWQFGPHVLGYRVQIDPRAMRRSFVTDPDAIIPVGLFVRGDKYSFLGLFESDLHLFGPIEAGEPFFLLGADRLGRDVLSRTIHGARVSMSIGLVGVLMSLAIGVVLGGLSGYLGGFVDSTIQRTIEIIRSIPTIPLWMGLAAAVPLTWHPLAVYFAVTVILSLIGWTTIARIVRGKFLSLRSEDFVVSARLDGASQTRIILVHMLPSFYSYIIAATTLAVPTMILSETALSFIGLGLQPPMVSWGVLLKEAQNIRSLASAPWLFAPGVAVMIAVLSLSFLGDGLRDAADPYQK
ncbi:Peptide/nickel transport system permease protein [Hyphomicrobiales bacterium]|nr:Peptide/nickel transport system permease protein [Hyphomicrobiales bacterium]CAH1694535.1 Peptide/nickel transport system permease protein [Hyphomicrobiales bacterium]